MRIVIHSRRSPPLSAISQLPSPAAAAPGRHTGIAPANLQAVLDSAANAGQKGQAAWFTSTQWASALALALPGYKPVIVDLTCGNGQLLAGSAAPSTQRLLGCDIETVAQVDHTHFIQADITQLAGYLARANWTADLFVLNFPFDHHLYRDRLAFLSESKCAAVNAAFDAHDGRTSKDTIDSTVAALCLALDRCSPYGEGFIIANHSTVERLIFKENAPHAALAAHIWLRLTVDHNICAPAASRAGEGSFETDILYFARSHRGGVSKGMRFQGANLPAEQPFMERVREVLTGIGRCRTSLRAGSVIRQYEGGHTDNTLELWNAVGLEWRTVQSCNREGDRRWNIWLDADGTLDTYLTPFQEQAEPLKKAAYTRLAALKGQHPMQLILQKAERKELENAVFGTIWRVAPAVAEAVRAALAEYNEVRAPLYPLSPIQRLGYLDDNDDILCLHDLDGIFTAGHRYTIRTETLGVKRTGRKLNLTGDLDDVQWEGSELALFIKDDNAAERLFMEERLRANDTRLSIQGENDPSPIDYNLQDLIAHFEIPEVPDVASKNPTGYQRNLDLLKQIEAIINHAS